MTRRRLALAAALASATACSPPPAPPVAAPTPPTQATTAPTVAATTVPTTRAARARRTVPSTAVVDPPEGNAGAMAQTARVSWYGSESGSRTANGEAFDGTSLTFAHRTMAFGTLVRFCHAGRCVVARANDRGPAAWTGKTFDLSRAVFAAIAPLGAGVVTVTWEAV